MHGGQKCASELGEDFAWGAKTCLRFGGRFCTGCINVPQIWGKILHGVQKHASVLGEDFAWGAKTCLRFGGDFCTVCINVSQFSDWFLKFWDGFSRIWTKVFKLLDGQSPI